MMMEFLSNLGLPSSGVALLLIMAFLSFGQKLFSNPGSSSSDEQQENA